MLKESVDYFTAVLRREIVKRYYPGCNHTRVLTQARKIASKETKTWLAKRHGKNPT